MKELLRLVLTSCALLLAAGSHAAEKSAERAFKAAGDGEFSFDTGLLRGALRSGGKSLGITSLVHVPTGQRLDGSNGLLSHYRVFTRGVRYGGGAWDWPSEARLREDGAVEVRWPAAPGRPFEMRAVYRWRAKNVLDLETAVTSERDLIAFECFVASYFSAGFTNAVVSVNSAPERGPGLELLRVQALHGDWQMFPRDAAVLPVIRDGRWLLEPHPVAWTIRPFLHYPLSSRCDPAAGLAAVLMSPLKDCMAVASPHETEGHYSTYFSLFGRDLNAGERAVAHMRLVIAAAPADEQLPQFYQAYLQER